MTAMWRACYCRVWEALVFLCISNNIDFSSWIANFQDLPSNIMTESLPVLLYTPIGRVVRYTIEIFKVPHVLYVSDKLCVPLFWDYVEINGRHCPDLSRENITFFWIELSENCLGHTFQLQFCKLSLWINLYSIGRGWGESVWSLPKYVNCNHQHSCHVNKSSDLMLSCANRQNLGHIPAWHWENAVLRFRLKSELWVLDGVYWIRYLHILKCLPGFCSVRL